MPPFVALWDPKNVLEVGPEIAGIKCVGHAKTKSRRCRNHIARENYQQASRIILQISRIDISTPDVDSALAPLARLLICRHWNHQDQVGEVVAKWRYRIQHFQVVAAAHPRDDSQIEHHAARQEGETAGHETAIARQETTVAHQETEVPRWEIEGLRRDIAIARREAETARRDAALAHQETEIARRDATVARRDAQILLSEVARALRALAQQVVALSAAERPGPATPSRTIEVSQPNLASSSTRHPGRPSVVYSDRYATPISLAATPHVERRPTTIPSPSTHRSIPTEEDSNLPSINGECSICLHDLGHERIVRCAARCQQPFHSECINAWLEVRRMCPLW